MDTVITFTVLNVMFILSLLYCAPVVLRVNNWNYCQSLLIIMFTSVLVVRGVSGQVQTNFT